MDQADRVADILETAADEIEARGWCQDRRVNELGEVCAVGALHKAMERLHTRGWCRVGNPANEDYRTATAQLKSVVKNLSIPVWNDKDNRTKQEVLDALRLAAKNARSDA